MKPCRLCSLVLMVSRGKRETSTAVPASPPEARDVRKLTSVILKDRTSVYIRLSYVVCQPSQRSIKHHIQHLRSRSIYLQIFISILVESKRDLDLVTKI